MLRSPEQTLPGVDSPGGVRSTRMTSLSRSLGVVPEDLLALAPNSSGFRHGLGFAPRSFLRYSVPENSPPTSLVTLSRLDCLSHQQENFRRRSGNAHVFASSRCPDAAVRRLGLAKIGFLRHLAALQYVGIRDEHQFLVCNAPTRLLLQSLQSHVRKCPRDSIHRNTYLPAQSILSKSQDHPPPIRSTSHLAVLRTKTELLPCLLHAFDMR